MAFGTTELETDLDQMINDLPITCTFSGSDYTGTKTVVMSEKVLRAAGLGDDYKFSVIFKDSDFSSRPVSGQFMTIDSVVYQILATELDDAEVALRVDFGEQYA